MFYAAELGVPVTGASHQPARDHMVHAKHCFDYLRQALVCAADTALEPVDEATGFVTGMGVVHTCQNFEDLVIWAEERRFEGSE